MYKDRGKKSCNYVLRSDVGTHASAAKVSNDKREIITPLKRPLVGGDSKTRGKRITRKTTSSSAWQNKIMQIEFERVSRDKTAVFATEWKRAENNKTKDMTHERKIRPKSLPERNGVSFRCKSHPPL